MENCFYIILWIAFKSNLEYAILFINANIFKCMEIYL